MFMMLTAMLAGILNSNGRFAAAAAAPVLLNLMFIGALTMLAVGLLPLPGHALAWAVAWPERCNWSGYRSPAPDTA